MWSKHIIGELGKSFGCIFWHLKYSDREKEGEPFYAQFLKKQAASVASCRAAK
jgi:hypothetical protein